MVAVIVFAMVFTIILCTYYFRIAKDCERELERMIEEFNQKEDLEARKEIDKWKESK